MGSFKRTTTYGGLLICADHNVAFRRLTPNNKNVSWKCGEMIRHGLSACESPILYESELDDIFHKVIAKLIEDKSKIISLIEEYQENKNKIKRIYNLDNISFEDMYISSFNNHTRAFVKIQDGCDAFCSYCIIPYARGPIRSQDPKTVIKEITGL